CHSKSVSEYVIYLFFFFSSRRRHTRSKRDWSSDVCSSDLTSQPYVFDDSVIFSNGAFNKSSIVLTPFALPAITCRSAKTVLNKRSEERRVGKERREQQWEDHYKK